MAWDRSRAIKGLQQRMAAEGLTVECRTELQQFAHFDDSEAEALYWRIVAARFPDGDAELEEFGRAVKKDQEDLEKLELVAAFVALAKLLGPDALK